MQMGSSSSPHNLEANDEHNGGGRPIPLVYYSHHNAQFNMDSEAVDALNKIKGPIGVVTVCGPASHGKSFLLNLLLGRSSGFRVASTHQPCTKGLWMWSTPFKRTACDGTKYNLLLLDSEGIDASDQMGKSSTQMFCMAVFLSSMLIYNQIGGIDKVALDRLSFVTEMTKHIQIRSLEGKDTMSELGEFSPTFVWLIRDFFLDLVEDNRKIKPCDYLELALRSVQDDREDVATSNEIRESIRALFPDRKCFTLVHPLDSENEYQCLERISMQKLVPEFRSGIDELRKYVFERSKLKQVEGTLMTGPILAGITKSFLDALNSGAVPTISASLQSVEEAECRRAYDAAIEMYMSAFDHTKFAEELSLREAHEEAFEKSIAVFNARAVGAGSAREKYEQLLRKFLKNTYEDHRRNVFLEGNLKCSTVIQSMVKKLQAACEVLDENIDRVLRVLDGLLAEYEVSTHGPVKWEKLATFLWQSLQGPISNHVKKQIEKTASEKSAVMLKCHSLEEKVGLLNKELEASEKFKLEYKVHYEEAINDLKKLNDSYMSRITNLENSCNSTKDRCSSLMAMLDSAKQESFDWKRKYEEMLLKKKVDDQISDEISALKSMSSAAEARIATAHEEVKSAREEAKEWRCKYDGAVEEAKAALEKAATMQECSEKQAQLRENAMKVLDERCTSLVEMLKSAEHESLNWKGKYEEILFRKTADEEQMNAEITALRSTISTAEARIAAAQNEVMSAQADVKEWKSKYDYADREAKDAIEKIAKMRECSDKQAQLREDALKALDERCSTLMEQLECAKQESLDWKGKHDKKTAEDDLVNAEITALRSSSSTAEARIASAFAEVQSAQEVANQWQCKYDVAVRESKASLEKMTTMQELSEKQAQLREDALVAEFSGNLAKKEEEIKDLVAKLECAEQHMTSLRSELKVAESRLKNYELETSALKQQIQELDDKLRSVEATVQSFEREVGILEQEIAKKEQQYVTTLKLYEEVRQKCEAAEMKLEKATEFADRARAELAATQNEKYDVQQQAMAKLEKAQRQIDSLMKEKAELVDLVERFQASEADAMYKVALLEARIKENEEAVESLLKSNNEQRSTLHAVTNLLENERAAHAEANSKAEFLSLQLQSAQDELNSLQQESSFFSSRGTSTPNAKLTTAYCRKRARPEVHSDVDSVQDTEIDEETSRGTNRSRRNMSLQQCSMETLGTYTENEDRVEEQGSSSKSYIKFTVVKLCQELTKHGFGPQLLELKNPKKKELLALYEKLVLHK